MSSVQLLCAKGFHLCGQLGTSAGYPTQVWFSIVCMMRNSRFVEPYLDSTFFAIKTSTVMWIREKNVDILPINQVNCYVWLFKTYLTISVMTLVMRRIVVWNTCLNETDFSVIFYPGFRQGNPYEVPLLIRLVLLSGFYILDCLLLSSNFV